MLQVMIPEKVIELPTIKIMVLILTYSDGKKWTFT